MVFCKRDKRVPWEQKGRNNRDQTMAMSYTHTRTHTDEGRQINTHMCRHNHTQMLLYNYKSTKADGEALEHNVKTK